MRCTKQGPLVILKSVAGPKIAGSAGSPLTATRQNSAISAGNSGADPGARPGHGTRHPDAPPVRRHRGAQLAVRRTAVVRRPGEYGSGLIDTDPSPAELTLRFTDTWLRYPSKATRHTTFGYLQSRPAPSGMNGHMAMWIDRC